MDTELGRANHRSLQNRPRRCSETSVRPSPTGRHRRRPTSTVDGFSNGCERLRWSLYKRKRMFDRLHSDLCLTESKGFAAVIRLPLGHRTCDACDDRICSHFAGTPELSVSFARRSRRSHPDTTDFPFPNVDHSGRIQRFALCQCLFGSTTTP